MIDDQVLRDQIREKLKEAGVRQIDAARILGYTPKHISWVMTGRTTMTIEWASKLLDLCGYQLEIRIVPNKPRPRGRTPRGRRTDAGTTGPS